MLAARCLLEGIDPVYVMREAWVERDSLAVMRTDAPDEPLSLEALRRRRSTSSIPVTAAERQLTASAPARAHRSAW